jgi:hypothetical protein
MEALISSETSLLLYQTTGRHISESSSLHIDRHDNLYFARGPPQVRNTSSLDASGYFLPSFPVLKMEAEISSEIWVPNDRGTRLHRNIGI